MNVHTLDDACDAIQQAIHATPNGVELDTWINPEEMTWYAAVREIADDGTRFPVRIADHAHALGSGPTLRAAILDLGRRLTEPQEKPIDPKTAATIVGASR